MARLSVTLNQLALYAYKDASQYHIESRCREQFLAGLHSREVRSHLGLFCSCDAKVHELVSSAEAYRAAREETDLLCDGKGPAVTIANLQGYKPGKSFAHWQQSTGRKETPK